MKYGSFKFKTTITRGDTDIRITADIESEAAEPDVGIMSDNVYTYPTATLDDGTEIRLTDDEIEAIVSEWIGSQPTDEDIAEWRAEEREFPKCQRP